MRLPYRYQITEKLKGALTICSVSCRLIMKRLTQTHELKTWTEYFDAVLAGKKTFEVRKNDRDFHEGDILLLNKWDNVKNEYAGSQTAFTITYVLKGGQFGIEEGYCVLGLKPILPAGCR